MRAILLIIPAVLFFTCTSSTKKGTDIPMSEIGLDSLLKIMKVNEVVTLTCTYEIFEMGDCPHSLFSCGDFGVARVDSLTEEEQNLWFDMYDPDTLEFGAPNKKYVGKQFKLSFKKTNGIPCQPGYGTGDPVETGDIPLLTAFKMVE